MPLVRPTLTELTVRIQADMISRLGTNTILRRSVVRVLARVFAGVAYLFYGFVDELSKQRFTRSAEGNYLDDDGAEWGVTRKSSTFASGPVTFSGDTGATIPAGWILQNADRDQFSLNADVVLAIGAGTGTVTALEPGMSSNTPAGSVVEMVSPIAGVFSEAVVASGGITGGTDQESNNLLRERIVAKKRQQGLGGHESDWINWVKDFPGLQITRVWVFSQYSGPRTLGIFFTLDTLLSIIPTQTDLDAVLAYLETKRPIGSIPRVFAPVPVSISLGIALSPNTVSVREAVRQSLRGLFLRTSAVAGTIKLSHINEAVSTSPGEIDHTVTDISVSGNTHPVDDVTVFAGRLPVLGEIVFSTKAQ